MDGLWQAGSGKSHVQAQPKEGMAGGVGRAAATPELLEVERPKRKRGPRTKRSPLVSRIAGRMCWRELAEEGRWALPPLLAF